jgi:hypothetical protein
MLRVSRLTNDYLFRISRESGWNNGRIPRGCARKFLEATKRRRVDLDEAKTENPSRVSGRGSRDGNTVKSQ